MTDDKLLTPAQLAEIVARAAALSARAESIKSEATKLKEDAGAFGIEVAEFVQ
jgi:hypothetical protein